MKTLFNWPVGTLLAFLLLSGCVKSPDVGETAPFESQELDACLSIVIDMSGSFSEIWEDRAYDLFLNLSDRYFNDSMGTENRLIISQLSGNEQAVLFEGTPTDLRRRFRSPQELSQFLKGSSDPGASHVYEATRRTLDYVGSVTGVTSDTRLLTVILSDMIDTQSASQIWDPTVPSPLSDSLRRYQAKGGGLALYFVAESERERWNELLRETGFQPGHYVIESSLAANPQLPRFD
ncbi:hypothetical protein [Rubinisphaera margarita]|uniref:hypothetical protein n=1 Tax=Rubinisphaera margarita TaxID=2909586 RepID=UPI001EE89944|nr:hypothetical protein [Rubinisphaera margarita]MCG6157619.1 hypothetical protein [Rubinisphaera margarita]